VVGLDAACTVIDPIGTLVSLGAGFLIEHFNPMKGWLDDLVGNPAEVAACSATWNNIAASLNQAGADIEQYAKNDLFEVFGEASNTYTSMVHDAAVPSVAAAADAASAVAASFDRAAAVVKAVHDLVRDVIAGIVGSVVSAIVELAASFGTAAPAVVTQVSTKVGLWSGKIAPKIKALGRAIARLVKYLNSIGHNLTRLPFRHDVSYIPSHVRTYPRPRPVRPPRSPVAEFTPTTALPGGATSWTPTRTEVALAELIFPPSVLVADNALRTATRVIQLPDE